MASDDGWHHIPPRGRRGRQRLAEILATEAVKVQTSAGTPSTTSVLSVAEITADHEKLCGRWRASSAYADLRAIISEHFAGHAPITTAVCLGLGSFDVKTLADRGCRASHDAHVQLEAFQTIVKVLEQQHTGKQIKCYAQEPSFTPSDRAYLSSLGIDVLDSPAAFGLVTARTFVFGIHLPHYAWGYALAEQLPGLYVGTDLRSLDGVNIGLAEDEVLSKVIERVGEIARGADRWAFPVAAEWDSWLGATFAGTDILWRRRRKDDEEDHGEDGEAKEVGGHEEKREKGDTARLENEVTGLSLG
ncbi:hypothetical protein GE09DRAFT_1220384 [Coniochaeta sp. 2T2.1]|nr:hypothetical protein GE09DRAFT_1220384 [Coniochaeta sp. 2T2.1]